MLPRYTNNKQKKQAFFHLIICLYFEIIQFFSHSVYDYNIGQIMCVVFEREWGEQEDK